ncbi:MAG: aldolase [Arenicellales bacterium]|nr:aldolase [Arenicellales bacterium]MDP7218379.1 aldolase [Arenicellales bacterium]
MATPIPVENSLSTDPESVISQGRVDLAVALRWAARLGLSEGVDNHFSMAVPDKDGRVRGDRFLINPYGWHWSEITASSLVLADAEGNVLEGENTVEDTAFFIHSRIHVNVPSATVVLHNHMPYTTALTLLENGRLEMCEQNALQFDGRIVYDDDYTGLALDREEGDRLAGLMGDANVLFMASHGVTVVGESVARAFTDLYYLERASMFQVLARSTGGKLRTISESVLAATRKQMNSELPLIADRHFKALGRILDREEPEYRF